MFVRIPLIDEGTGQTGLLVLDIEDRSDDPLSSIGSVDVVPALIASGLTVDGLVRLNSYRSAILHGYCTDELRPGEADHEGAWQMPGEVDWSFGLTEAQRNRIMWLHADRATGRLGGPDDGSAHV